jgi:nitroimidazol reductase NimA-like FMN-containing flavoprotein (pyridoxamine 5'-phosphate oxidase superfamily)
MRNLERKTMRRTEKAIEDRAEIDAIIRSSQVGRLGLSDQGTPYVVPLCFGYDGQALYFHCAREGRKLDILRQNDKVCFEFDLVEGLVKAEQACDWGMRYRSVIGFGRACLVEDAAGKAQALALIMAQYSNQAFSFPPEAVRRIVIVRIEIQSITGKQSKRLT